MRHFPFVHIACFAHLALAVSTVAVTPRLAHADEATDKARKHYETGLELFYAREHAQALVEFQRAHEVKARPATLFMMGQCEYLLGALRQARDHYQAYLQESPTGEFVEVAKDRVEAINRRPATLVINAVPDQVDIRITMAPPAGGPAPKIGVAPTDNQPLVTGQAPNNFTVPRGRWVIAASKTNYVSQQAIVEVEVADTKPLFFKLEPIPARLEVETTPATSTLYVNGLRASNPYRQDVPPGRFELLAEATDYEDRTDEFVLGAGEKRLLLGQNSFRLRYIQRSGRPELLAASAVFGGLAGAGAVAASLGEDADNPAVSTVGLLLGGAVAGTVVGALVANNVVPSYIPDNRALFVLGGMWVGAAEGALTGIIIRQTRVSPSVDPAEGKAELGPYKKPPSLSSAAFFGSLPGLAAGVTGAALMSRHAPTYGRVALIQSAAVGGALVGGLTAATLQWNPFGWQHPVQDKDPATGRPILDKFRLDSGMDLSIPALIGLNVGLGAGLLGAYLPDQSRYGPSWRRIALIDLAAAAGALAGGIAGCVSASDCVGAITLESSSTRARAGGFSLLGGGVGLLAGILLTRNVDREVRTVVSTTPPPSLTLLPMPNRNGGVTPLLGAVGFF